MAFKKLIEPLQNILNQKGYNEMLPLQQLILSKIKGGINMFIIAPLGSGKTTSLILSVINRLNGQAYEDAPRALIFVKDKQAALNLESEFKEYTAGTDLRIYCAYEEYNIELQREDLYLGTDIVIATPKRLNKILYLNGINLNKLQLCIVEDAEFLFRNNNFSEVTRTPESIHKCQYLIFSTYYDSRFDRWQDAFMHHSQIIEL
jgi:superfamily II DNA/RNA helicase